MAADQDTEITLGTGKMLVLFFGLVALCAVFFGLGFGMGRSAAKPAAAEATTPSAGGPRVANARAIDATTKPADLTFYKTVEQKDANAQLTPTDASSSSPTPAATPASAPAAPQSASSTQAAPPDPTNLPGAGSYYVQVAAVSKQEDADALVDALKKKQYPAFTASGTADKLFHVQVGPYGEIKDAEGMRAKLIADGYNPILKK
jgi:cell division septation protein DedD